MQDHERFKKTRREREKKTRNLTMTNLKNGYSNAEINFSTLALFCLGLFHFSDKFLLLSYSSLLTALSTRLDELAILSESLWGGSPPHAHYLRLFAHAFTPIFLNLNKPLSHENRLLWSLLRFLCGSSERASVAFFCFCFGD
jgi:hypothetical protein